MTNSKQNIYDTFINACKQKMIPKHTRLHKHHIVPKHDGGGDETENFLNFITKRTFYAMKFTNKMVIVGALVLWAKI